MQKYACNNCGNQFIQGSSTQINCPACGSGNVTEMAQQSKTPVWKDRTLIILIASALLMLIILFLLPSSSRRYDLYLEKYPDQCKFTVIVKDGKKVANTEIFKYSSDNGKTWQMQNEFLVSIEGSFTIKVVHREDSTKIFTYRFNNPFTFSPTCKDLAADPCDCKKLQILSVETKEINKRQALIIHASQPDCPKSYSVSGETGKFQDDSIFYPDKTADYEIFVKSASCEPVAYSMNPFHVSGASGVQTSAGDLGRRINKFIQKPDNTMMYAIIDLFESASVKVNVNNNTKDQPTIYEYLQRLKTLGITNGVVVKVTRVGNNNYNKINQLSIMESQQK